MQKALLIVLSVLALIITILGCFGFNTFKCPYFYMSLLAAVFWVDALLIDKSFDQWEE